MTKKYELTNETTTTPSGATLYRIRALRDFGDVKAGDLGGFVEAEYNLSHKGDCWIYDNARVYGNACVVVDARISDRARVFGYALVMGSSRIFGNARIFDNVVVCGNSLIGGNSRIFGRARIEGIAIEEGEVS